MLRDARNEVRDDYDWLKATFMVSLGRSFESYVDAIAWSHPATGSNTDASGTAGTAPEIQSMLSAISDDPSSPLPVYFTRRKCRDTTLGGNDAINCLYQFNETDDVAHPFTTNYGVSGKYDATAPGMGRNYSQVYDDSQQIMYLTFGKPIYNSIASFYTSAVRSDLADLMNKGSTGVSFANVIGDLVGRTAVKIFTLPVMPLMFLDWAVGRVINTKVSKYYDFSPDMMLYYRCVNTILIHLGVNMGLGLSSKTVDPNHTTTGSTTNDRTANEVFGDVASSIGESLPEVFQRWGLDMRRIMARKYMYEEGKNPGDVGTTDEGLREMMGLGNRMKQNLASGDVSWTRELALGIGSTLYEYDLYVGFRIEKTTDASESLSNQTGPSEIAQTINAQVQNGRSLSFSAMGGNIGDGGFASVVKATLGAVGSVIKGGLSQVGLDGIAATLTGSATIEIPEVWQDSSFSKNYSFSLKLRSPYGDPFSIYQSIYVPLACLLAGALPLSTGVASYTAPFLVRAYSRGLFAVPLGIIDSMTIARAVDQHSWTYQRQPTAIDVSFTIKDLSPVMHMAMGGESIWDEVMGDTSNFQEYLMTLSGMGTYERTKWWAGMQKRIQRLLAVAYDTKISPFYYGMAIANTTPMRVLNAIIPSVGVPRN